MRYNATGLLDEGDLKLIALFPNGEAHGEACDGTRVDGGVAIER